MDAEVDPRIGRHSGPEEEHAPEPEASRGKEQEQQHGNPEAIGRMPRKEAVLPALVVVQDVHLVHDFEIVGRPVALDSMFHLVGGLVGEPYQKPHKSRQQQGFLPSAFPENEVKPPGKERKEDPHLRYIVHQFVCKRGMEAIQVQKQLSVEELQGFKHSLKIEKRNGSAKPAKKRSVKMLKNPGGDGQAFLTTFQQILYIRS